MATTRIGGATAGAARAARLGAGAAAGVIAGLFAGALMAIALMLIYRFALGASLSRPIAIIGTYLFGDRALELPTPPLVLFAASLFLLAISAAWGLVYGIVATLLQVDRSRSAPFVLGLVFGTLAQIVDINLLTPVLMRAAWGHDLWAENVPPMVSWVAHVVVFGLSLALYVPAFRRLWLRFAGRDELLYEDPRIK
jgi:hypothetical protein